MRRLVICCDGTWNTPDQHRGGVRTPTNVAKLHSLIAKTGSGAGAEIAQISYYRRGVGTSGGLFRRLLGGAIGLKLEDDIMSAYKFLAETYEPGDEIFLFGFSRGAYTVRSLAGMVSAVGLADLRPAHLSPYVEPWDVVKRLMRSYAARKAQGDAGGTTSPDTRPAAVRFHSDRAEVGFRFIGVWDTVGALGIPDDKGVLRLLLGDLMRHEFSNTTLGANVACARHALAMDERRKDFTPTLWTRWAAGQDVEQRWFPGVHADVGGSYEDSGLGDLTLDWMLREAQAQGLALREIAPGHLRPDAYGRRHTSYLGWFRLRPTRPRAVPEVSAAGAEVFDWTSRTCFDASVLQRQRMPPPGETTYWPTNVLLKGQSATTIAAARRRWNPTGIYLERGGCYRVVARGSWQDAAIEATANGAGPGLAIGKIGYALAALPEALRRIIRKRKGFATADVAFSRRVEAAPWFALIGAIANGQVHEGSGDEIADHEYHRLGEEAAMIVRQSGYLYLFANDAWQMYGNNAGVLKVEITRLS